MYTNEDFVGRTRIENCYRNDQFKLSLGIDKKIHANYNKPDAKKVHCKIFTSKVTCLRTIAIENGYENFVNVLVLDELENIEDTKVKFVSLDIRKKDKKKCSKIISKKVDLNRFNRTNS